MRRCAIALGGSWPIKHLQNDLTIVFTETDLDGIDQSLPDVRCGFQAINEYVGRPGEIDIQQGFRPRIVERLPVLIKAAETSALQVSEQRGELILRLVLRQWVKHIEPRVERPLYDGVGDLIDSVLPDSRPAIAADRYADSSKEQTQVVINFSRCSYSRAGSSCCIPLADCNCRSNAVNFVDIRFLDPFQELPRVSGKRLNVSALPFRINRVKCE